jgi:hypothetical protein
MPAERARDIARGLKWLADRYLEAEMSEEAEAALADSHWWLSYAATLLHAKPTKESDKP